MALDVVLIGAGGLGDTQSATVLELLSSVRRDRGHTGLPEPQMRAVEREAAGASPMAEPAEDGRSDGGAVSEFNTVLAFGGGELAGAAFVSVVANGSRALHVVVGGDGASGGDGGGGESETVADALIEAALADFGDQPLHLWAMQAAAVDDHVAQRHGFAVERDLLQMRVPLPLAPEVVAGVEKVATRPFDPDRDVATWLDVNNRAFAGHPEQGQWSEADLRERLDAPWVDLDGFLVADAPEGDGIIGSCWTKVHQDTDPVMGEIYVISVDPDRHGKGWGKALTVAGLEWLAGRGVSVGMLYTDADNEAAVAVYRGLGFSVDHIDREYVREP